MGYSESEVVKNIIQIRNIKGFTKREMAKGLNINEASYGRIESGAIALSYSHLAQIAKMFDMSVVDLIAYPAKMVEETESGKKEEPLEAILQIKLRRDKQDQVLKLVFGDNNLEILNKL